ncbi:YceI family protein [Flavobacterium sp.]|uniref:YceI family protein n=1 Tax=Flavobacterium sp. TaxID=239 RepID=UPI003266ADDE
MKTITTLYILLLTTYTVIAQEKLTTNSGEINFEATVPFLEEIKAVNRTVAITLEPKTNTFLCVVMIKDFHFNLDLMEQHFNENYLESERYPKAVFKGKITNFDLKDINASEKEYVVHGKLYIHGKFKDIETKLLIKKVNEGLLITSNFPISISDFNISIPEKVTAKISKTANTKLSGIVKSNDQIYLTLK